MTEKDILHKNLIVSVLALANNKQKQLEYCYPGCAICDIIDDFNTYGVRCYDKDSHTEDQNEKVSQLALLIEEYNHPNFDCFEEVILDHPSWIAIRNKALSTLTTLGYKLIDLPKPLNKGGGIWHTNILSFELKKAD